MDYTVILCVYKNKKGGGLMFFSDFEYNNQRLSDYGCMVCNITSNSGIETKNIGNKITFNTVDFQGNNNTGKFRLLNTSYEERFSTNFEICKYDCNNLDNRYFSDEETTKIVRWLNQKKFHKFRMIYSDSQYPMVYYNGSFNVELLTLNENVIGMLLNFESDAPFGYYEQTEFHMDFSDTDNEFVLYDISDETGYLYPDGLTIRILEDGDLTVCNSLDKYDVVVNSCKSGELITLDGRHKIIHSNMVHENLHNDFNYNFLKVINNSDGNTDEDGGRKNIYKTTLKCKINLSYSPIAKVGVV